ncbi:MAG: FAD assembly factor SdhE [Betaproteobacteria bacterium]
MSETDRIRWQCRRGMLELDLVLAAFLDRYYAQLDGGEVELFRELLDQPDNELLDLVMGRAEPADARFDLLLGRLRENCAAPTQGLERLT